LEELKIKQRTKTNLVLASLILAALVLGALLYQVILTFAASPSQPIYLYGGAFPSAYTFTIWKDGSNYFAKDRLGRILYNGANLSGVTQNCLDYIETNAGGSLYFEPTGGVYEFEYSMFIPSNTLIDFGWSRLKMGDNFNFATVSGATIQMFSNKGFPYTQVANVTIQNAIIDGNHDGQTEAGGIIAIKRGVKIVIRNLHIEHSTYDGHDTIILAITNASLIEHIVGYDAGVTDGAFIGLRGCRNVQIRDCYLENSIADLIAIYQETEHVYGVNRTSWDISISGCTLVGAGRNAIRVEETCYEIRIHDNTIYDAGRDPLSVFPAYCDHAGIFYYGVSDVAIHDNTIRAIAHNMTYGVYLYGYVETLSRAILTGNLIRAGTVGDIYLRNCTQVEISSNRFDTLTLGYNLTELSVHHNLHYITELCGTGEVANLEWIAFGSTFPVAPQTVVLSVMENDARYLVQAYTVNRTHVQVLLWDDTAGAYELVAKTVAFHAVFTPPATP